MTHVAFYKKRLHTALHPTNVLMTTICLHTHIGPANIKIIRTAVAAIFNSGKCSFWSKHALNLFWYLCLATRGPHKMTRQATSGPRALCSTHVF